MGRLPGPEVRLSIYTFVRNGLAYDFHVVAMLRHHLPLADEIIVNEGYSTDGSFEAIADLDPKIQVFRTRWGRPEGLHWYTRFKNEARRRCHGDWCLLLDCDEFIPEWEFERLRQHLENTEHDLVAIKLQNFYGNYKVYHTRPRKVGWPERLVRIHRNLPEFEAWGDGANVGAPGMDLERDCSSEEFACHHFGYVRHPARLRQKWHIQGGIYGGRARWLSLASFLFDWMPHRWNDPLFLGDLTLYEGPFIRAVCEDPSEFVRDGFRVYDLVSQRLRLSSQPPFPLQASQSVKQ